MNCNILFPAYLTILKKKMLYRFYVNCDMFFLHMWLVDFNLNMDMLINPIWILLFVYNRKIIMNTLQRDATEFLIYCTICIK